MPAYDAVLFDPPAPVARVRLRNPGDGALVSDVPMLLDTGADVSLVPQTCVDQLGLVPLMDRSYELVGFDGTASFSPVVRLELSFEGRSFRGQFLLTDQGYGVLGRNVLNALPLLLDGPRLTWGKVERTR